jgi:hypothetical protein
VIAVRRSGLQLRDEIQNAWEYHRTAFDDLILEAVDLILRWEMNQFLCSVPEDRRA